MKFISNRVFIIVFFSWILYSYFNYKSDSNYQSTEELTNILLEKAEKHLSKSEYSLAELSVKQIEKENPLHDKALALLNKIEKAKTLEKVKEKKRLKDLLTNQLEKEIESIKEGIDFQQYKGSHQELLIELALFTTWERMISEGKKSSIKKNQVLADKLLLMVSKIQIKEFPKMRNAYFHIVEKALWEINMNATISGERNQYITIMGMNFDNDEIVKTHYEKIKENLVRYRFDKATFLHYWLDENNNSINTEFTINSFDDKSVKPIF